jgi:beta-galactosidase
VLSPTPVPMESLGQSFGFIAYRTRVTGPRPAETLHLQDVHDRALVFLDGQLQGVVERDIPSPVRLAIPAGGAELTVLVENMGRINYGPLLADRKGITHGARLGNQFLYHWEIYPLPLHDAGAAFTAACIAAGTPFPAFFRGHFTVDAAADTFVHLPGWMRGVAWVNGFNLGRYWERGPQRSLYVPGPLLRPGLNELVLFEQHGCAEAAVELRQTHDIG